MNEQNHNRRILHVDMDAFYAAVEVRDNPELKGKPVIIGTLPGERGVVSTCNYKAREYGVRSAMPISEAYKRCPHAHFMYPNMEKYAAVSKQIHAIWADYTDIVEYLALDEGFLDVTASLRLFGSADKIAQLIRERTWLELGLTCSVGLGYSMSSAKLASEEMKPNGYFEILTPRAMRELIANRSVRTVYTVGPKTAERLNRLGIKTVADIWQHEERIINVLGNHGAAIAQLAKGIDNRVVGTKTRGQSIGTEQTFQTDIADVDYLKDVLRLTASKLSYDVKQKGIFTKTVTLKITYPGMQSITRAKTIAATNSALDIYQTVVAIFEKLEPRPIRLIGITLSNFSKTKVEPQVGNVQLTLFATDDQEPTVKQNAKKVDELLFTLQQKHGQNIVKSASELGAELAVKKRK